MELSHYGLRKSSSPWHDIDPSLGDVLSTVDVILHEMSIVLQLVICSCLASAVWWSSFVVEVHQEEISPRWCIRLRRYHSTIVLSRFHWHRVFFYMVVLLCWVRDCRTLSCHFNISSVLLSITVVKNIDQVRRLTFSIESRWSDVELVLVKAFHSISAHSLGYRWFSTCLLLVYPRLNRACGRLPCKF